MSQPQLERKLGLYACIAIVVGSVIGSSIFMKPATMAGQVDSPMILLLVWVIAGIVSMFGGMINAEIGAMIPDTGGQYVYFRKMYGDFFAFVYGWAAFIVINTAAIAAIAFVFAQYAEYFVQLPRFSPDIERAVQLTIPGIGKLYLLENIGVKGLAIIILLFITWINYYSVKAGSAFQVVTTLLKVFALLVLIFFIFFSGKGNVHNFFTSSDKDVGFWVSVSGFIAAMSGALAAFDGWNNIGFAGGEIKNPDKNIPRGLFIGLFICIIIYVLTNLAFLYVLPMDQMKNSVLVASDAIAVVSGITGGGLIALMVVISCLGALNGNTLSCARITFAMGQQKIFSAWAGQVHPSFKTPGNALWLHGIWSCLFVLTGSFDMLADLFVFISWIFYGFAAYGVFILRRKMPDVKRPYKVWGYPVIPIIFIFFAAFYFVMTLYNDISAFLLGKTEFINSVYGLGLTLAGIPVYYYYKRKYKLSKTSEEI